MGSGVGAANATRSLAICVLAGPSDLSARGTNAVVRHHRSEDARLRRAAQRDDRQVLPTSKELDVQFQRRAGLAAYQCPRSGGRRAARPTRTCFVARLAYRRKAPLIDFVGRGRARERGYNRGSATRDGAIDGRRSRGPPTASAGVGPLPVPRRPIPPLINYQLAARINDRVQWAANRTNRFQCW